MSIANYLLIIAAAAGCTGIGRLLLPASSSGRHFIAGLGIISGTDNPAASPAVAPSDAGSLGLGGTPKTVLSSTRGPSDVTYHGTMTLNAPTTTPNGLYTGTVTFTVA